MKTYNNFNEYVEDGNFIGIKAKGLAKVKCYFNGISQLEVGRNILISGPRQCGKSLLLLNYAIYLLRNTNSFIVFMSDKEASDKILREKLSLMTETRNCSPSKYGDIYNGISFKNELTGSQIVFQKNSIMGLRPTHLFVDNIDFCLEKTHITSEVFEDKSGIKTNIKESRYGMQKVLTCLSGFEQWINMNKVHKAYPYQLLTEKEFNNFEYIDDLNKTETVSLRLESNLLSQTKSAAEESEKSLSEYMRNLIERDLELRKIKEKMNSKEQFFIKLLKNIHIKYDAEKHPGQFFWCQNSKIIMRQDLVNNILWAHSDIWCRMNCEEKKAEDLIKKAIKKYFNMDIGEVRVMRELPDLR